MHLTSYEKEKLLLHLAGELAKNRLKRGIKLNYPESLALITNYIMEGAREGKTVKEIIKESGNIINNEQVMDGVPHLLKNVQVEATFPDGTKLVSVHNPIKIKKSKKDNKSIIPGQYNLFNEKISLLPNRNRIKILVKNGGSRPIQVGSHFHFYETNSNLIFKREKTKGYRLDILSGRSIRFEPGETKEIFLVEIGGSKKIYGFSGKIRKI
ncbi:urease subunit gamma [Blattabacterium cuenoti]|uniref:urease subunit gamma n=1 Tax=Blattabacterium cuenoti TaxID=1653831 RepID=UPI00163CC69A|nr:urease subunit gamma [Blattabacterium cuenoti]